MKTKIIFAKSALMITFVGVAVFTQIQPLHAQEAENASGRERLLLDFGWRFKLADPDGVGKLFDYPEVFDLAKCRKNDEELEAKLVPQRVDAAKVNLGADVSYVKADFDDGNWRMLNIPHDWTVELGFDQKADKDHGYRAMAPELGTTIGWYRRTFDLPESDKGKALWLEFDGVFRNCLVWLNGKCLGRHLSGYSSFKYDISNIANYGGSNTLVVRVDATRTEGWFYEGAGIYRHVWLVKTPPLHVAHWGTFVVSTPKDKDAQVTVETTVRNDSAQTATGKLVSTILDAEGKQVGQAVEDAITVEPGNEKILKQNIDLKDVTLWSLENPYLYKLVSRVEQKSSPADVYDTTFGIRTVAFDCDKGFFLNGKQIYIKGTCNHQDHAGVGVALPDRLQSYRLEKLKEFGCNAYRSSHNPPTPELLDACDRMGILVLDEQRRMGTTPEILDQLKRLMLRDRNHPCIFLWALGNEEWDIQGIDKGGEVTRKMKEVANQLDPSRLKTVPMSGGWGSSMSEVVDVQGCNYFHNGDYDAFRKQFPKKPILGTEEGSTTTTRGVYENNKEKGHLAAYDDNAPSWASTAELWWKFYMERPWIGGVFVWTGFDYRGEPTPLLWPCISSHFGIMDTCGFPKDNYYFYKSWWTDETVLHLLPHWNWPGKEGRDIDVRCFSNCDEVELFLNGQSLGKKPMPRNSHLAWRVKYEPGTLGAKGYKNGKVIAEEKVETTGAPAAIKLTPDRTEINADGEDIAIVNVAVLDAQGRVVPVADNEVRFQAWGNARIIGVGNGDPSSYEPDKAAKRKAFNGLCQFIVQSTRQPGSIELKAISPELQSDRVLIESKPARPRPAIIPAGWESPIIAVMSPPADAPKIRLNTIGYLPDREKKATVAEKCSIFAVVRVKDGAKVFEGTVTGPVLNEDTREQLYTADFSALKEPGEYRLDVPDVGQSAPFRVTVDVFNQAYYTVMRAMYMWRCGTAVKGTYNGITFSHEACHTNDAWLDAVTGKHEKKDSTKGWHDAGDYNKYTINAAVTVGTMLRAWEDFGPRIQKISLDIPETGGKLPDFLAEIKCELDWLLK
ncbi:MAG TPA: beta-galactosidase GalA, partial [Thermoguttaceae bacterium]